MTNPERDPQEVVCEPSPASSVEIMSPREVPLGGLRAMTVRRTLPQRQRSLIGAWCFVDHYGPDPVDDTGGMNVAPHPHTGLQTVSWLFEGEIEHRDSAGNHAMVRPGQVNLMTAGRGISHSEVSTPGTRTLHGAQLWVALPDADRHADPGFAHHEPSQLTGEGWSARVFLGSLLGDTSPVSTYTPLLGAEILLDPDTRLSLDVDPAFEHGVLVDSGLVSVGDDRGQALRPRLRADRQRAPRAQVVRRADQAAAARRAAVRRADRDVVELRGAQPRGDHRVPRGVAGADRGRCAPPTDTSASRWATCCRRSRLPCCRTLDSGNGASSRRPAPSVQVGPGSTGAPVLAGAVWVPGT